MLKRFAVISLIWCVAGGISTSCSEDIPDCPSKMCIIAGGWKLTEVKVDNVKETSDLSQFRLMLSMPNPTEATTSDFTRTQPSGNSDSGTWSIENNETILRLQPGNDPQFIEDWIIESFSPRQLILVMNRDAGIKQGPSKIEFILEPF
jgi:hypothetical protein